MIVDLSEIPDLPQLARQARDKRPRAIDLFAGWGGFTDGATLAGVNVVWAANHSELAVKAHAAAHPNTVHSCQELSGDTDYSQLPDFDLLLASPCCQGNSRAAQPSRARSDRTRRRHDRLRATALSVIGCADMCEPKALIVENTLDFRKWRLYPRWRQMLEDIGYHLQEHVIRASHHGVPQRRDRLFVVGTKRDVGRLELPRLPEVPFGPHVQWDADVPWKPVRKAPPAVRGRIAKGRKRCGPRFISQHVTGHPGVPLDEPLRTITTKDQWVVVDGRYYRMFTLTEYARGMGFADDRPRPADATREETIMGLGNAVCPPVAQKLISTVVGVA